MILETNPESYLNGILKEIERKKAKGKNCLYRISHELSKDVAVYINNYFIKSPNYDIEMKKCATCTNTYDIIIFFK